MLVVVLNWAIAECRLINDDEVLATIKDPNDIVAV